MSGLNDPLYYKQYWGQFNGDFENRREIETYDNFAAEYAGIKGVPIEFYALNVDLGNKNTDVILGEDSRPHWDRKYKLTAILEDWSQEVNTFNAPGMENIDTIVLYIHRSTFDKLVGIRSLKPLVKTPDRRGAWGPVAKDEIMTPYNGLVYEVVTGGLHFLPGQAQHFGHKFWYKLTCKVRQVSNASVGDGEQYGAMPNIPLDDKWKGNPQFILPTPTQEELAQTGTPPQTGAPTIPPGAPVCYVTTGSAPGPGDGTVPEDILLPDGRVADMYQVTTIKDGSKRSDGPEVKEVAKQVVDPQSDLITVPGTPPYEKYGPAGRTIVDRRSLWGDW